MLKKSKPTRSFSLNSLEFSLDIPQENIDPNKIHHRKNSTINEKTSFHVKNPSKDSSNFEINSKLLENIEEKSEKYSRNIEKIARNNEGNQAKLKLLQVKKAKEKIQRVLDSDLMQYEYFYEKFVNKKEYLSIKEQEVFADLIETNRRYKEEKSKKFCPLEELLANPDYRAAFFSDLYSEFEEIIEILDFFKIHDEKTEFLNFHQAKIKGFHDFFELKMKELQVKEINAMLKEDIQGKVIQSIEFAFELEECENRLSEYRRTLDDIMEKREFQENHGFFENNDDNKKENYKTLEEFEENTGFSVKNQEKNKEISHKNEVIFEIPAENFENEENHEKNLKIKEISYKNEENLKNDENSQNHNDNRTLSLEALEFPFPRSLYSQETPKPTQGTRQNTRETQQSIRLSLLQKDLSTINNTISQQKLDKNEIFLNLKACKEMIKQLKIELENGRKRRNFLQKSLLDAETMNNMKEFEENLKGCLQEKSCYFNENIVKFFDYKGLFIGSFPKDYDEILEQQKRIIEEVKVFPNGEEKVFENVIKKGLERNKHFIQNLSVFFEFKQDLYIQVGGLLRSIEEKSKDYEDILKKKYELEIELQQKETSLFFLSKQNNRKQTELSQISSNIIKIKDFLAFSAVSTPEELTKGIMRSNDEIQGILEKRLKNQKILDDLLKQLPYDENAYLLGNKVAELYGILTGEKSWFEKLREIIENDEVLSKVFKRFYEGLMRNFNLLENKEGFSLDSGLSIQSNLQLFEGKIEMLKNELEKVKTENLREMCQLNSEMLRQQLSIDENRQKIKALDRYIENIKVENNIKTTQTTKPSEESLEIDALNKSNLTYNPKINKNLRHKSFSFVNNAVNNNIDNAKYGNVSIDLRGGDRGSNGGVITHNNKSYFFQENRIKKENNSKKGSFLGNNQSKIIRKKSIKSIDLVNSQDISGNFSSKSFIEKNSMDFPLQIPTNTIKTNTIKTKQPLMQKTTISQKVSKDIKIKILKDGLEVYKVTGNEKSVNNSTDMKEKPRILKIDKNEKKIDLIKKYSLAGKEKIALENSFLLSDIKSFELEVMMRKINKNIIKEICFKFDVSQLGLLKLRAKNYEEGKGFNEIMKEAGVEHKNIKNFNNNNNVIAVKRMR